MIRIRRSALDVSRSAGFDVQPPRSPTAETLILGNAETLAPTRIWFLIHVCLRVVASLGSTFDPFADPEDGS